MENLQKNTLDFLHYIEKNMSYGFFQVHGIRGTNRMLKTLKLLAIIQLITHRKIAFYQFIDIQRTLVYIKEHIQGMDLIQIKEVSEIQENMILLFDDDEACEHFEDRELITKLLYVQRKFNLLIFILKQSAKNPFLRETEGMFGINADNEILRFDLSSEVSSIDLDLGLWLARFNPDQFISDLRENKAEMASFSEEKCLFIRKYFDYIDNKLQSVISTAHSAYNRDVRFFYIQMGFLESVSLPYYNILL
jgi:hypothetical protein